MKSTLKGMIRSNLMMLKSENSYGSGHLNLTTADPSLTVRFVSCVRSNSQ